MDFAISVRVDPLALRRRADGGLEEASPSIDVRVRADRVITADEFARGLGSMLNTTAQHIVVGGERVADEAVVGEPPLINGAEIRLTDQDTGHRGRGPASHRVERRGVVDLGVVSGPDCGFRVTIPPEGVLVGREPAQGLCLGDAHVSREHARIRPTPTGIVVDDLGSTNGVYIDGSSPSADGSVCATSRITMGHTGIRLIPPAPSPGRTVPTSQGHLRFHRMVAPRESPTRCRLAAPPEVPEEPPRSPPWLAILFPLPVAAFMAWFFGPQMLAFAALGPLMMAATWLQDRHRRRRARARRKAERGRAQRHLDRSLAAALNGEREARERRYPHAVEVLETATTPSQHLWSRDPTGEDFGLLRLGVGTVPAATVQLATTTGQPECPPVPDAPVTTSWAPGLAIIGPPSRRAAVVRHLVGQLAVHHSPADVHVAVLTGSDAREWDWVGWLPHAGRALVTDPMAERGRLIRELDRRLSLGPSRSGRASGRNATGLAGAVPIVVVLTEADEVLREWTDGWRLVDLGPSVGLFCIAGSTRPVGTLGALPRLVLRSDAVDSLLTAEGDTSLMSDGVGHWWADRLARALAPLVPQDAPAVGANHPSPTLWTMHDLPTPAIGPNQTPTPTATPTSSPSDQSAVEVIATRWTAVLAEANSAPAPSAPVGLAGSAPWIVDLVADGPHVLVGGTTGSGKSELLRALILGWSVALPPQALTFLLMDFKGGAAFGRCSALPHTVGLITDLDSASATRALVCLRAEILRRETLLSACGVADLDGYWSDQHRVADRPLPRLVVVVDEFRVLAQVHPEVLAGIVHCAAVGRSLGIHVVLATQRPTGVISADIQANVNLRIALRMRDVADSDQVIGAPDAAHLEPSRPGTGYARYGSGELTAFQALHVSGPVRIPAGGVRLSLLTSPDADQPGLHAISTVREPSHAAAGSPARAEGCGVSDEAALVDVLVAAQEASAAARVERPWLPPLPAVLEEGWDLGTPPTAVPLGLLDQPAALRQEVVTWTPGGESLRIIGGHHSGRTTALVGLAVRLADRFKPDEVHVYAVEAGASLASLANLAHVGAIVAGDDLGRLRRLASHLREQAQRRRRTPDPSAPDLVLIIDDWDQLGVAGHPAHDVIDQLVRTMVEGRDCRMSVVAAGAGGAARIGHLRTCRTIVLGGLDATDQAMLGIRGLRLGGGLPPGRGVVSGVEGEVQLGPPLTPIPYGCAGVAGAEGRWPTPIHDLPARISRASFATTVGGEGGILLGVGHDGPLVWEPQRWGRHLLVAGPAGSGRTTALATLAAGLVASGRRTVAVTTDPTAFGNGVAVISGGDVAALRDALAENPTLAVLVDDVETLSGSPFEAAVRDVVESTDQRQGLTVLSARLHTLTTAFRGLVPAMATRQTAVLLAPTSRHDGESLGVRLEPPASTLPGRGVLIVRGRTQEIHVAMA